MEPWFDRCRAALPYMSAIFLLHRCAVFDNTSRDSPATLSESRHALQFFDKDSGLTFKVGMNTYFILDNQEYDRLTQEIGDNNHPSTCEICGKHQISAKNQMIECDYCVRNFHKHCLAEFPEDLSCWECPVCTGDAVATQGMTTLSEIFCRTEDVIKIGCIERLWQKGGQIYVELQEYERTQVLCKTNAGATLVLPCPSQIVVTFTPVAHLSGHSQAASDCRFRGGGR